MITPSFARRAIVSVSAESWRSKWVDSTVRPVVLNEVNDNA